MAEMISRAKSARILGLQSFLAKGILLRKRQKQPCWLTWQKQTLEKSIVDNFQHGGYDVTCSQKLMNTS
jgi:hypothetical protein